MKCLHLNCKPDFAGRTETPTHFITPWRCPTPGCPKVFMRKTKKSRSSGLQKRSKIQKVSDKHRAWESQYQAQHRSDDPMQGARCPCCRGRVFRKEELERHHPYGRKRGWILIYVYICSSYHTWIHAHGREARALGWLQPEYEGRDRQSTENNIPKPWLNS